MESSRIINYSLRELLNSQELFLENKCYNNVIYNTPSADCKFLTLVFIINYYHCLYLRGEENKEIVICALK